MAAPKNPRSVGPKSDKRMRDALLMVAAETLPTKVRDQKTGRERVEQIRKDRLLAMSMFNAAIKGDAAMARLVTERIDGKLPTVLQGDPDAPLVQQVTHQAAPVAPKENYDDLELDDLVRAHTALTILAAGDETKH